MPAETALQAPKPQGPIGAFWSSFTQNRGAVIGLIILALVIGVALFADFIAPHSAVEQFRNFTKLPPAWVEGGNREFLLGTDALGRDMLSRLIYGARISLFIGLSVMIVSVIAGIALGLIAAYLGVEDDEVEKTEAEIAEIAAHAQGEAKLQTRFSPFAVSKPITARSSPCAGSISP